MERLTEKHYLGTDHYMKCSGNCDVDMDCIDCPSFDRLVERLAAYEDTGLEPEEIDMDHEAAETLRQLCRGCDLDRLCELAEADKDGRVVVSCWIPVTERLPEDSVKECIIFVPHIPENIVGLGRYLGAGRWVLDGWYLTPEAVAYWMPLPEAPHKKALEAMKDV
jgi:hypothetical protein